MIKLIAQVTAALFLSDLIFILLARFQGTQDYRSWAIGAGAVYLLAVAASSAHKYSYCQLLFMATLSSSLFVSLVQLIGQLWFPGIVKNGDFLSLENFSACIALASSVLVLTFALFSFAKAVHAHLLRT